ncbi:MAG TPA: sigma 54-interacting transcriptional regulator [Polyangiaceae bacterium]|nr:sigma 54-interacting transcriptional regulator [Polyangiaceae bacterium]
MVDPTRDVTLPIGGGEVQRPALEGTVVRVVGAPAKPRAFVLQTGVACRIGNAADCDVVISEPTVSRAHAELTLTPQGIVVRDLGSRNGTFYLGQRVEKATLSPGATLTLGAVVVNLEAETPPASEQVEYTSDGYQDLYGRSQPMKRLFGLLTRIESSLTPVLVQGESGTGKEMVARAIHDRSALAGRAFVALNCGALPRDLIGSELFGHRKGAFTGAIDARKGAFETAHEGTLLLDEVGELPLELQPLLLRVLETGEVRPLGGDEPKLVKVRVIAATNRDLEQDVQEGRFREDLFYRLAVIRVRLPALRERMDDIEPLAQRLATEAGLARGLDPSVVERLKARPWSGNVRELRNTVQAYVALGVLPEPTRSKAATLDLGLREMADPRRPYAEQKDELVERFTALYLEVLLDAAGGNQTVAARWAGLDRGYLGRLIAKYGVQKRR